MRLLIVLIILLLSSPALCGDDLLGERFFGATEYAYKVSGIDGKKIDVPLIIESFAMIVYEDGSQGYVRLIGIPLLIQEVKINVHIEDSQEE